MFHGFVNMSSKKINRNVKTEEIIKRIEISFRLTRTQIASEIFDLSAQNLSNRIKRGTIDLYQLSSWAFHNNVNINWLITGQGEKYTGEAPDTPESTTSDKSIHRDELFEKILDFIGSDTLKESFALFLANLLNDVIHKLIQDEIKEKNHLADLVNQFKEIMINVKPPEGVGERRSCAEQIEKLLRNNN